MRPLPPWVNAMLMLLHDDAEPSPRSLAKRASVAATMDPIPVPSSSTLQAALRAQSGRADSISSRKSLLLQQKSSMEASKLAALVRRTSTVPRLNPLSRRASVTLELEGFGQPSDMLDQQAAFNPRRVSQVPERLLQSSKGSLSSGSGNFSLQKAARTRSVTLSLEDAAEAALRPNVPLGRSRVASQKSGANSVLLRGQSSGLPDFSGVLPAGHPLGSEPNWGQQALTSMNSEPQGMLHLLLDVEHHTDGHVEAFTYLPMTPELVNYRR